MKPITSFALLGALVSLAAQGAVTDPVGYTTHTVYGAFGPGSPKNNVLAPELQNPAIFVGTVASISGDQVVLTGAALTPGAHSAAAKGYGTNYTHFIETADGYWAQVVSNDATSTTVETGAGANFTVGETVTLRRHVSIADYFGANNETGLLDDGGSADPGVADNVILIDEVNGGTITVFPTALLGGAYATDGFDEAGDISIYPDQGMQVLRKGLSNLSVVQSGEVDVNGRQIEITTGVQIRPVVIPVPTTLTDLDLVTAGSPATGLATDGGTLDPGQADVVTVLTDGIASNYFYSEVDLGSGAGWHDDGLTYVGATPVPAGSGLIINRGNPTNSSPFIWINPAPTIAP